MSYLDPKLFECISLTTQWIFIKLTPPVRHHRADYIFWSFGILELMLICFEYTILLTLELGGVRDVAQFLTSPVNRLNKTEFTLWTDGRSFQKWACIFTIFHYIS